MIRTHTLIAFAIVASSLFSPAYVLQAEDQEDREEIAAIINNCLDDNSARQCLGQYPEYADDEQLQEELAAQAENCKTRPQDFPDDYCE